MGCEGRGIYWTLIEMLYENNGYLPYDKLNYYANALRTDSERIATVLNDYGLFENDGKQFWSKSCLERLKRLEEKREKARQSSYKRWRKDANALGSECEPIPIKESKVKESKVKEKSNTPKTKFLDFVLLTDEERKTLVADLGEATANEYIERLNNYIGAKGKEYKSHYHAIRTWFAKDKTTQKKEYHAP